MITKRDIDTAIADCQNKPNPDGKTCMMLAAFLTIKRELFEEEKDDERFSYAPAPVRNIVEFDSDSEFARAVDGMDMFDFLSVIEELVETIKIIQPKLYKAVIEKLSR